MQKSKNNDTSGLPKIAKQVRNNKALIMLVILAALVVIGFCFINVPSHQKVDAPMEESYTLKNDAMPETKVVQSVSTTATDANNQKIEEVSKEVVEARVAFVQAKQQELQQRLSAPLMLVNSNIQGNERPAAQDAQPKDSNPNTQFLQNAAHKEVQSVSAVRMGSLGTIIAEGNFIHAILEPVINSDLPGSLRAIVSTPTYAEDGSRVLIPRGSRLIGEYKSGMLQGQARLFIVWSRLITPDGTSVQLGSQDVDPLGAAGMSADSVDRHFWERFGMASLLSMIGAGAATVGVSGGDQDNSVSSYRSAVANSFSQSASQSLQQEAIIAPTLKTMQGKPIMVFVAKDLQFADALKETTSNINVF